MSTTIFDRDDLNLIVEFAGCSLDEKPGSNWVQEAGGLPDYICRIARAVRKTGKSTSQAIAIAVSRVKKWAGGADNVNADTRAKAAKALAEWERLKAKSGSKVKASRADADVLCLANADYPVDLVRSAWEIRTREARKAWRAANPNASYDDGPVYSHIREQWTSYLIVQSGYGSEGGRTLYKVPFTVDDKHQVTFGEPAEVKTEYVVVSKGDMAGDEITDAEIQTLMAATGGQRSATDTLLALSAPSRSALDSVVALAAAKPYGNVTYADPGYKDNKKRYPIDTAAHVRAAWSYINQKANQSDYTPAQVAAIKAKIKAAAVKFHITISD